MKMTMKWNAFFFPQAALTDYFVLTGTLGMKHCYSVLTAYLSSELPA